MNENLRSYLTGLLEGDGCIYVPYQLRDNKNRKLYPYIKICFNINDLMLAQLLNSKLGGNLLFNKIKTYVQLIFTKTKEILSLISLVNGFFRTPKINDLNRLIDFINLNYNLSEKLIKKSCDVTDLGSNSWLAGFIDADGNFSVTITNKKKTKRILLAFRLELTQTYKKSIESTNNNSFFFICSEISKYLGASLYVRNRLIRKKEYNFFMVIAHNIESHKKVCNYLIKYPLFSSKYLNYCN